MSAALFGLHDMLENMKIVTTRPGLPYRRLGWGSAGRKSLLSVLDMAVSDVRISSASLMKLVVESNVSGRRLRCSCPYLERLQPLLCHLV